MSSCPLVILPVRAGVLPVGSIETVQEAIDYGDGTSPRVVLIGSQLGSAAGDLCGVVESVECCEAGDFAVGRWAAALAPLLADATCALLPGSPDGRDLATRLAADLALPLVPSALSIAADHAVVARHGGRVHSNLRLHGRFIATLQPGVRSVSITPSDSIRTSALDLVGLDASPIDAVVVEVEPPDAATMDLADAPRIVGGGAGLMGRDVDSAEVTRRFADLAQIGASLGASMGATRVVTDAGYIPHSRQIGTTGVVVDPRLYLAFGISGAVQHTAGLGSPDHVISINTDPHCPMMSMADLAIVSDAAATLVELGNLLNTPVGAAEGPEAGGSHG